MSFYRRAVQPGGTFFFTVVTFHRRPLLATDRTRAVLRRAMAQTCRERPFENVAMVLLPDHLHTVWTLPRGDADFSTRWRLIKTRVTQALLDDGVDAAHPSDARRGRHQHAIWQPRFWEHTIRDDEDLRRHMDYIHWNPVKHGLVSRVRDWPWSTFHRYVQQGLYPADWGCSELPSIAEERLEGE